jgi:ATP-binding cassette, subfamily B, bacterial
MRTPSVIVQIWKTWHRIVALVWRSAPREMGFSVSLELLSTVLGLVQLLLAKRLLDQIRVAGELGRVTSALRGTTAAIAISTALIGAVAALQLFLRPLLSELVSRHAYGRVLAKLGRTELEEFDRPEFHDRLNRLATEGVDRPVELIWALVTVVSGLLGFVTLLGLLASLLPEVVPLVLLATVPLVLAGRVDAAAYREYVRRVTPIRRATAYLRDLLISRRSAAELMGYRLRPHLEARHDALQAQRIAEMRRMVRRRASRSIINAVLTAAIAVIALTLVATKAASGSLSISEAVTVAIATQQLSARMQSLRYGLSTVYQNRVFLDDLVAFIEPGTPRGAKSGAEADVPAMRDDRSAVGVELHNVSFTYPGQNHIAVNEVSMSIGPGQIVALVGENGSGKSTLAKLIAGLYRPQSGAISVDGTDLASLPTEQRSMHAATVFQDFARFALTARENVAFGDVARLADEEAISEAVERSGLGEIVTRLPDGLDTVLATEYEGGTDLSSGQWQRIAIARAFFRDAPLLVLDEPTAALDARAEYELFERVRLLSHGRTVILISHRLATVRHADRIIVMGAGSLREAGTHDELMAADGLYAELIRLQAATGVGSAQPDAEPLRRRSTDSREVIGADDRPQQSFDPNRRFDM